MDTASRVEAERKAHRTVAEVNPQLLDAGLCTALLAAAFSKASTPAELSRIASRLGTDCAVRSVRIEGLVEEFSRLRWTLEDDFRNDHTDQDDGLNRWSEVRVGLDTALALTLAAYSRVRTDEARRDSVTGLSDRVAFETFLLEEVERAKRYQRTFSLILFDLDDFKSINDLFGHLEGDRVLAMVANVLTRTLRRSDRVFRFGGDEFAAVCFESGESAMASVLQRIEAGLGELRISTGVATFPGEANDGQELVRLADERLYECKRAHHEAQPR